LTVSIPSAKKLYAWWVDAPLRRRESWVVTFQQLKLELHFDPSKCFGCRACQVACAYRFFKVANAKASGIKILGTPFNAEANVCKQCLDPKCLEGCGMEAIYKAGGVVYIDYNSCTGCGACVEACPFGSMNWLEERKLPVKCDLCGGSPACVKACPTGALEAVSHG
jgi:carbon-monoxide dehydrogenase iron sulfur subunit